MNARKTASVPSDRCHLCKSFLMIDHLSSRLTSLVRGRAGIRSRPRKQRALAHVSRYWGLPTNLASGTGQLRPKNRLLEASTLGTPQHRVSERGSSVAGGARPSHALLARLAELEERRLRGNQCPPIVRCEGSSERFYVRSERETALAKRGPSFRYGHPLTTWSRRGRAGQRDIGCTSVSMR